MEARGRVGGLGFREPYGFLNAEEPEAFKASGLEELEFRGSDFGSRVRLWG